MPSLDIEALSNISALLDDTDETVSNSIKKVLDQICESGFEAARYYAVIDAEPHSNQDKVCVLMQSHATDNRKFEKGFAIKFVDTTFARNHSAGEPAVSSYSSIKGKPNLTKWAEELGLVDEDSCWVDIPLRVNGTLVGLLSCDWHGDVSDIDDCRSCLRLIGDIIARSIELYPSRMMAPFLSKLAGRRGGHSNADHLFVDVIDDIREFVNACTASVFKYDFIYDRITKLCESRHSRYPKKEYKETYEIGEKLSGAAWQKKSYRYIIDFAEFQAKNRNFICRESEIFHRQELGLPVKTILYAPVGRLSPHYMIRLVNREDEPKLPFGPSQKKAFELAINEISDYVDELTVRSNLQTLENAALKLSQVGEEVEEPVVACVECLADDNIEGIIVLSHTPDSKKFNVSFSSFPGIQDFTQMLVDSEWASDKLYEKSLRNKAKVYDILDPNFDAHQNPWLKKLNDLKVRFVLAAPFSAFRTKGAVFIPLPRPNGGGIRHIEQQLSSYRDRVSAVAAVIGNGIAAAASNLSSVRAMDFVGYIGHEVNTPISEIAQSAIEAIEICREAMNGDRTSATDLFVELEELEQIISSKSLLVDENIDIASVVALQSKGVINVHFQPIDLAEIITQAIEETTIKGFVDGNGNWQKVLVSVNEPILRQKLTPACGDPGLLKGLFANLIRNAMKYSLPRYSGKPVEINVFGSPQSNMNVIEIKNYGFGIKPDEMEKIFLRFTRGSVHDRLAARRGMGLGLYMSRGIARMHKGELVCKSSEFKLDDPVKLKNLEGFVTTFQLKMPAGLKPGSFDIKWEDLQV